MTTRVSTKPILRKALHKTSEIAEGAALGVALRQNFEMLGGHTLSQTQTRETLRSRISDSSSLRGLLAAVGVSKLEWAFIAVLVFDTVAWTPEFRIGPREHTTRRLRSWKVPLSVLRCVICAKFTT